MLGGNLKLFVKNLFDQSQIIFNILITTVVFGVFSVTVCTSFHAIQFDSVTLEKITHDGVVPSDFRHIVHDNPFLLSKNIP